MGLLDTTLWLRADTEGAEVASADETGINFNIRKQGPVDCVVGITSIDNASANETYVLDVAVSDLVGGTYTDIANVTVDKDTAAGTTFRIPLNGSVANFLDADCDWIRISVTAGGTTPSIDYFAYLAPAYAGVGQGVAAGA